MFNADPAHSLSLKNQLWKYDTIRDDAYRASHWSYVQSSLRLCSAGTLFYHNDDFCLTTASIDVMTAKIETERRREAPCVR